MPYSRGYPPLSAAARSGIMRLGPTSVWGIPLISPAKPSPAQPGQADRRPTSTYAARSMKKRNFLIPVAVAAVALAASSGANATEGSTVFQPESARAASAWPTTRLPVNADSLLLQRPAEGALVALHGSHVSHGSHGSHGSHSSHVSGY